MVRPIFGIGVLIGVSIYALADRPMPLTTARYCSDNAKFCVVVHPGTRPPQRGPLPRARLLEISSGTEREVGSFPLLNYRAPGSAIVSGDGAYVVTFDEAGNIGEGEHVVVIYKKSGAVVRKFALSDLVSAEQAKSLPRSVSAIHWWTLASPHRFDETRRQLVLKILEDDYLRRVRELRVDLKSGAIVR